MHSVAGVQERTITITGYAWCKSSLGISIPTLVVCDTVTLNTSNGHSETVTPTKGPIGPLESGRFTFTDVAIPGRTDLAEMAYTVSAEAGSGLTDGSALRCEYQGSIQGAFFQGDTFDLFWLGGPWTTLPFSECNTPA